MINITWCVISNITSQRCPFHILFHLEYYMFFRDYNIEAALLYQLVTYTVQRPLYHTTLRCGRRPGKHERGMGRNKTKLKRAFQFPRGQCYFEEGKSSRDRRNEKRIEKREREGRGEKKKERGVGSKGVKEKYNGDRRPRKGIR